MKKAAALLLLCFSCAAYADQGPVTAPLVELNDFTGGLDTQHLSEKLPAKYVRDNFNFRTDENLGLSRRKGFDNATLGCSSFTAANKLWDFIDPSNNEWLVRLDSAGSIGGTRGTTPCLTTAITTGPISIAVETDADVGLGKIWFTNKVDGLMSWDGGTYLFHPNAPKAARVAIYRNRIVLSDVSNAQSSLRLSGELNGDDWSNDSRFSTSPMSIPIGGVNDGAKVYDFFPGMGEGLVFKALSMYRLLGNDQRDFRVEQITPEIGTIYPNTIAQRGGYTLFLSNRGLDAYTPPYTFTPVGNPIQNMLDPLSRQTSLSHSLILDSEADWRAGISSPTGNISTYTFVGDIAPNNHTFLNTQASDWNLGFASNTVSISTAATGSLFLTFTSTAGPGIINPSFETAGVDADHALDWDVATDNAGGDICTDGTHHGFERDDLNAVEGIAALSGTYAMTTMMNWVPGVALDPLSTSTVVQIVSSSGGVILSQRTLFTTSGWTKYTLDTSALLGRSGQLKIGAFMFNQSNTSALSSTMSATFSMIVGTSIVYYARADSSPQCSGGAINKSVIAVDVVLAGFGWTPANLRSNFVSQTFDTRLSSPTYDPFRASVKLLTVSSGTVTWGVQTSSADSNCCWSAAVNISTWTLEFSTPIMSRQDRYIRYVSTFEAVVTTTESVVIQIASVTLGSYATGYYRTAVQDVGTSITSWGLFTGAQDNGGDGNISYDLQSNSVPQFVEANWVPTSLNTIPVIPVNRYVFARMTFQTKASTTIPFVDNITFNWNTGAGNPVPVASTYREAYYLFYSTSINNITKNDRIAVFNRNNALDQFFGSTISAVTVYNNTLEMGDAYPTGNIYALDKSTSGMDGSGNVQSSVQFHRLDAGHPDSDKIWDYIYFTISREDTSLSQLYKIEYAVDGSTTFYRASNVEISTGDTVVNMKSDIPVDQMRQGHYLDVKLTELTTGTFPYTINRVGVYGTILEVK